MENGKIKQEQDFFDNLDFLTQLEWNKIKQSLIKIKPFKFGGFFYINTSKKISLPLLFTKISFCFTVNNYFI